MSPSAMTSRRCVDVHAAARVAAHRRRDEAAHDDAGRVRAVRGVRDDDALGVAALGQVRRADDQQAGELAVGAGRRLQRGDVQAADLGEPALELVHQLEGALHQRLRLVRVQAGEAVQARGHLVHARVVLHRAAAERVAAAVHAVVERAEAGEVTQQVDLADLGQARRRRAAQGLGDELGGRHLGHAELRQRVRAAAGARLLVDGRAVHGRRAADRGVLAAHRGVGAGAGVSHGPPPRSRGRRRAQSTKPSSSARVRFSVTASSRTSSRPAVAASRRPAPRRSGRRTGSRPRRPGSPAAPAPRPPRPPASAAARRTRGRRGPR